MAGLSLHRKVSARTRGWRRFGIYGRNASFLCACVSMLPSSVYCFQYHICALCGLYASCAFPSRGALRRTDSLLQYCSPASLVDVRGSGLLLSFFLTALFVWPRVLCARARVRFVLSFFCSRLIFSGRMHQRGVPDGRERAPRGKRRGLKVRRAVLVIPLAVPAPAAVYSVVKFLTKAKASVAHNVCAAAVTVHLALPC